MNRRHFFSGAAAAAYSLNHLHGAAAKKPNVVIILADDFGYGSLNCNGADAKLIRTPNLDRIAKEGIRFTDANTPSSVCSPSRYALLTGRYCWRTSLQYEVLPTNSPLHIETTRPTIWSTCSPPSPLLSINLYPPPGGPPRTATTCSRLSSGRSSRSRYAIRW